MLFLVLQLLQFVPLVTLNPKNSTFSAAWWVWGTCYLSVALDLLLSVSSLLPRMRAWVFFLLKANSFLKLTPGMVYLGRSWRWHLLDWPSESCPDMKQVLTAHFGQQSRRALVLEAFSSSLLCCRYSCLGPLCAFIPPSLFVFALPPAGFCV